MSRLLVYPFGGAAVGVLAAVLIVPMMSGGAPDTAAIMLLVGTFLAGSGAIAGAIVGAVDVFRPRNRTADAVGSHVATTDRGNGG